MEEKIDFVITWVDGNDKQWQAEKEKYMLENKESKKEKYDNDINRYRDMECLKYWFRGVEKFAPWVNKIYFVTCGQAPKWLNKKHEKLVLVNHSDYMPKEYLPTFNSSAIEIGIHKIEGLSEQFVYFNDDMFLINKVKETDFFKKGLPCDSMTFEPIDIYPEKYHIKICNDLEILNKHFSFRECLKKNKYKYLSLKQGKHLLKTLIFLKHKTFAGFYNPHLPTSFLKSTFKEVWSKEEETLNKTMSFKFRNNMESVNIFLFQYWQYASGMFLQRSRKFGKYLRINDKRVNTILEKQKYKAICINDVGTDYDFENIKSSIKKSFEKILPQKSSFEL
jgi:hypothetical protein